MRKTKRRLPTVLELEEELRQEQYKKSYMQVLRSTIYCLITVAAVAVLIATLFLPVLRIYGASMTPALKEGDIVVSVKGADLEQGDIISFYYNNRILVKRAIAFPGDWVNIDDAGNVYVNDKLLKEPYLAEKMKGDCDIEFPHQVPEDKIFVLGDHRSTSVDSRISAIGDVSEEQIVGKIVFRIWPLGGFGGVK